MANHRRSVNHLKRVDPKLARVIEAVGACRLQLRTEGTHFQALARAIVFQQLSGKAAGTIFARLNALYPTDGIAPNAVLATADEELRSVGMSRQKIAYLKDLSAKVLSGALPLDAVESMDDDDLIAHLVQVKGIGRWTAQMFLMFRIGRPDVLPELDLGIQNAIRRVYRMRKRPTPQQVKKIGARWSPHSSVACWYLWRSLENGDGQLGAD
ncbi:MAG TPA: DNA-3-methyladenine glycosylase [Gemmatimonadaceae bacterium]|jgi:3-methyladenine DNA glycosylase/8-oxoguanine DNA glycosylase